MSIQDLTVREFIDQTAGLDPMPGGGAVAAVSASLGLGLIVMAVGITLKRNDSAELRDILNQAQALLTELRQSADADVASYNKYVAARGNDQAMQQALIESTEVPLQTAKLIKQALGLAEKAKTLVTGSIAADIKTGQELLTTSLSATLHNVEINCKYIKDEELKSKFLSELK